MSASNDTVTLTPRTTFDGPTLEFDFPGLEIGCAEYDEGPTGCTVLSFLPDGAACSVDVRGGSPGWLGAYEWVHAICLAGGSLYGLEAATGVAAEILARRNNAVGWTDIPLVAGAIVFDFGFRENAIYPDKALGRAALAAARPNVFPLGQRGAGRSTTVGKTFGLESREPGGQGGAYRQIGGTRIAVFTVLNALGAIVDRDGTVVGNHHPSTDASRRSPPGARHRRDRGDGRCQLAHRRQPVLGEVLPVVLLLVVQGSGYVIGGALVALMTRPRPARHNEDPAEDAP